MKKLFKVLFLLLFLPTIVFAFTGKVQDDSLVFNRPINDDFYATGGNITIKEAIQGDLLLAGGNIDVDATVLEDMFLLGGKIIIQQPVGDDVRVFGGDILINDNVAGDVVVLGGKVTIARGVVIGGDLVVGARELIINGEVKGNLLVAAKQIELNAIVDGDANIFINDGLNNDFLGLEIGENVVIKGDLQYFAKESILELEENVAGEVEFKKISNFQEWSEDKIGYSKSWLGWLVFIFWLYHLLFLIVFASILFFVFEKFYRLVAQNLRKHWLGSALKGILYVIGMPIVIGMFFVSILGLPVGFLFLFFYFLSFLFYELVGTVVFSAFFIEKYLKKEAVWYQKLGIIALVALFFTLINGVDFIVVLFAIGALITTKWKLLKSFSKGNSRK